ncbi:fimbrial protein [Enterobacter ludwigii]|nr:fimbrial protein [Enterobacter ludwigii]
MKKSSSLCFYLILFMLFVCKPVQACYWLTGKQVTPQTLSVRLNSTIVQRDAPVGSTLMTQWVSTGNSSAYSFANCGSGDWATWAYNKTVATGYSNVYQTNVAGVGIQIQAGTSSFYYNNPATYFTDTAGSTWAWSSWGTGYNISLIKTANTSSGDIGTGQTNFTLSNLGVLLTLNITGGTVTTVACAITTPTLNFPIGNIPAALFGTTVGTTPATAQNTQNLGLNCDAGANINVSLTGTQNPDVGTTSVLALTGQGNAGVAQGVGVQILYNGSPLVLNNRIVLKQSSGGQETFPLTARYYQTKTSVMPGTANASATLNLTYQ